LIIKTDTSEADAWCNVKRFNHGMSASSSYAEEELELAAREWGINKG
jgi:hypothetical protein